MSARQSSRGSRDVCPAVPSTVSVRTCLPRFYSASRSSECHRSPIRPSKPQSTASLCDLEKARGSLSTVARP
ncbi:hypothetical protein DICSQDRAFT_153626 [Dichomitus squalens LYAD-421 SS1]|uniref:uncharacterized protein n=1 Tax=Dichomitus squalens (strain LYAD-421) TaxID=732165 RepID=UPI0004412C1D|nr:uncharacterized protein DICSQDRAFT_153626 [Dichomitus squalens LYAD-421 SS1]EJF63797.1 hypothetical protein DICSQDRAFT_153626 [Dichomitus squalens LYAD-421 SS1]